ncbi:MAG: 2'-deoxycytidine 5'-triphosphate deaminase [Alphaproteobacteria bacterium]|jgi:dCTP deaminase|nr:2'-deoxycytidine 5'-triphosphate deaminase [Alphaproteobacteria bacterium]
MAGQTRMLPLTEDREASSPAHTTGILPAQVIRALLQAREIQSAVLVEDSQIQPASIDLRLGKMAYRVRASFLPGKDHRVLDKVAALSMGEIDLAAGAILEKDCVYIVPLIEHLALSSRISAFANPKSSIGRLDIFTRLITDHATEFDRVRPGYRGPLYAEISPRAFSVVVREASRMNQLRFQRGSPLSSDTALKELHKQVGLVDREPAEANIANGLAITVDLMGSAAAPVIGYKAKRHAGIIDIDKIGFYEPVEFWDPIRPDPSGGIILNPGDFHILASKEAITVPPGYAAEMMAYDTLVGEFRVHYAGFFDPGFGYAASAGTKAVLEVRSHEVPFAIEDGQIVGRLSYERLTEIPDKLYGADIGSSYQRQGLALSKHFKRP